MQWTRKTIGRIHNPNKITPFVHCLFKSIHVSLFLSKSTTFNSNGVVNDKKGAIRKTDPDCDTFY